MTVVDESPEGQIRRLEIMLNAASSELLNSSDVYVKRITLLRFYLKCLLSELEHLPDNKIYSNYLHKITLKEIKKESLKKG